MLTFTELDFILVSALCYLCGVGTGLGFCAKYKETFMQRVKSIEDFQQYNHQNIMPPPETIFASAPPIDKVPVKVTIE